MVNTATEEALQAELTTLNEELSVLITDLAGLLSSPTPDTAAIAIKHAEIAAKKSEILGIEGQIEDGGVPTAQPVISSGAWAILYNTIALPGFQRWKPRYREGIISNLDVTGNLCTVAFNEEYEFSSIVGDVQFVGEKYSIFQTPSIDKVPVVYMECHAAAFLNGDSVIVSFSRDWETPTVIGFVDHPKFCGMYMESGFLNVLSAIECAELSRRPARIQYNTVQADYISSSPTPIQGMVTFETPDFEGQPLAHGSESRAIGCSSPADTMTLCDILYENGGYCPADILARKQLPINMPSSQFSGKLRMMVQAIYGSTRTDYKLGEDVGGSGLSIGGKVITFGYGPSFGLFTTSTFDYFLIEASTTKVQYHPIEVSPMSQTFISQLNNPELSFDADDIKKIEAYILSTAVIKTGDGVTVDGSAIAPSGDPWYYGWHWSWDGSQGDICLQKADHGNSEYKISRCRLDIVHSSEQVNVGTEELPVWETQHSFTNSYHLLETKAWWPQEEILNIIVPFPEENKMIGQDVVKNENGLSKQNPVSTDMPIVIVHVYRSMTDELVECKYEQTLALDSTTEELGWTAICTDDTTPIFSVRNEVTYAGSRGDNKLTVGGTILTGRIDTYGSYDRSGGNHEGIPSSSEIDFTKTDLLNRFLITCDGSTLNDWLESTGLFTISGTPAFARRNDTTIKFTTTSGDTREHRQTSSSHRVDFSTAMFLEIPYDSCSVVNFGQLTKTDEDTQNDRTWTYFNPFGAVVHFVKVYQNDTVVDETAMRYTGASVVQEPNVTDVVTITATATAAIDLYVNQGGTNQKIHIADSDETQTFSPYFNWAYGQDMGLDFRDDCMEDTSGDYKYQFASLNQANYEFEGEFPIGWA